MCYLFSWLLNLPFSSSEREPGRTRTRPRRPAVCDKLPRVVLHNWNPTRLVCSFDLVILMSLHSFSWVDTGRPLVIVGDCIVVRAPNFCPVLVMEQALLSVFCMHFLKFLIAESITYSITYVSFPPLPPLISPSPHARVILLLFS